MAFAKWNIRAQNDSVCFLVYVYGQWDGQWHNILSTKVNGLQWHRSWFSSYLDVV